MKFSCLSGIAELYVCQGERPCDNGVVLAQAPVHLAPRAEIHDLSQHLEPYVNFDIRGIFTKAISCKMSEISLLSTMV